MKSLLAPPRWRPLLQADWTQFVFAHFTVAPAALAPYTPLALACRDGQAFVSLVFFRFERMRPAGALVPAALGRVLGPAADCWFLNVRTYVRGPVGPGIQFLVEWMDNPISLHLGPLLYGLPYRRGRFERWDRETETELDLRVADAATGAALRLRISAGPEAVTPLASGSTAGFLLEHDTAYTHRRDGTRYFRIAHPPWKAAGASVRDFSDAMVVGHCPWFREARFHSAHVAGGFRGVMMGPPHRVRREPEAAGGELWAPEPLAGSR